MNELDLPQIRTMPGPSGFDVAYRHASGAEPMVVFLPGYMSDMEGGKATAVMQDCMARGQACLLLDYSGCGQSQGRFADGTLSAWRDEVLALIGHVGASRVIVVGSSMGGWLMLMVANALDKANSVAALVGIAPAPDFTEWGITDSDRRSLQAGQVILEDNPYGPDPTPTHPGFFADAQSNLMLTGAIAFDGPVRLIHGQRDGDVPWEISLRLSEALTASDIRVTLVKDGDHRLSRDCDIALLLRTIGELETI